MAESKDVPQTNLELLLSNKSAIILSFSAALIYFFSNPKPNSHYDYTFRVAEILLRGSTGFAEKQPPWLNEFVPFEGFWYSVFPFGAVVSMLPFAVLKTAGVITQMPSALIAAMCAGVNCLFLLLIANRYEISRSRIVLMTLGVLFGTWTWTNVTMGGAWQLALGVALVGELGAIYFTVYNRKPLIAGAFFALAFGNRTEILLTAPVFLYLLARNPEEEKRRRGEEEQKSEPAIATGLFRISHSALRTLALFCMVPFVLGVSTLVYNYVRFHSFSDFGYARIPGVLSEPWYKYGIFSYHYIARQIWEMLLKLWEWRPTFPLPMPNPFSSSILISSPFLLYAIRVRRSDPAASAGGEELLATKSPANVRTTDSKITPPANAGGSDKRAADNIFLYLCWAAVLVICIVLWMHGNSGGWQFGYRYAIACLPFLFVIMLETSPKKVTVLEWLAYSVAFVLNAYATWLFHWTNYLKP